MLSLAVIRKDDGDVIIGQYCIREDAGEYMYKYPVTRSYSAEIREEP